MALAPDNLSIAEIVIPDNVHRKSIATRELPSKWRDYPAPEQLANIGKMWVKYKSSLLLDIPSVMVEKELNTLMNPLHPDIKHVNLVKTEPFCFNSRLLI